LDCTGRLRVVQQQLTVRQCSYILSTEASCTELVKKSKFITHASPVDSFDSAMSYLDSVKDDKANHIVGHTDLQWQADAVMMANPAAPLEDPF